MNRFPHARNTIAAAVAAAGLALGGGAIANDHAEPQCSELEDAWINGSIETTYALNAHLSAFDIDTKVNNCRVELKGSLDSDVQRDLAIELAAAVDGVSKVTSRLVVAEERHAQVEERDTEREVEIDDDRSFGACVSDATIAAAVKTKLLANDNVAGTAIDVDVEHGIVVLDGEVETGAQADLALMIARNTDDVQGVENRLKIAG